MTFQIEEISSRQYGNPLIARGAFGDVSIALLVNKNRQENCMSPSLYLQSKKDADGNSISSNRYQLVAIKTIRNAVIATTGTSSQSQHQSYPTTNVTSSSFMEGDNQLASLSPSWGFATSANNINHYSSSKQEEDISSPNSERKQLTSPVFHEVAALKVLSHAINNNNNNHGEGGTSTLTESIQSIGHPNIAPLLSTFLSPQDPSKTSLSLVFPYHPIDLATVIQQRRQSSSSNMIPIQHIKSIMKDILSGLSHCHENHILHCDIKPANLLLTDKGTVQLSDFGLARLVSPPSKLQPQNQHGIGTLHYRPPEILFASTMYESSVDIWSAGLILGELLNLNVVFAGRNVLDQLGRIFEVLGLPNTTESSSWPDVCDLPDYGKISFTTSSSSSAIDSSSSGTTGNRNESGDDKVVRTIPRIGQDTYLHELQSAMLTMNPKLRPSALDCLTHSWFFSRPLAASSSFVAKELVSNDWETMRDDDDIISNNERDGIDLWKRKAVVTAGKRRKYSYSHNDGGGNMKIKQGSYSSAALLKSTGILEAIHNLTPMNHKE